MKTYNDVERGSVWRRWDLHVHTKGTMKNDQFRHYNNFDDFCVLFFKEALMQNISAIGITDYFSIDNYLKVTDFLKNISTNINFSNDEKIKIKSLFILPNVELRMLPSTDKSRLVNIHCIFNPSYVKYLDNEFFSSIEFQTGAGKKLKMNRQGIIDLGKFMNSSLDDNTAYQEGIKHFAVSSCDLQKLLDENKDFKENTIIVVSNSNQDGASAFNKHYTLFEEKDNNSLAAVRRAIYNISNAIFSSNEKDRKYFLGQGTDSESNIIEKYGSLKPCIHGSDAHSENKLFKPDHSNYCWIKADLHFEGLKQILHEPDDRVRIQTNLPEEKAGYQVIDRLEIMHNDFHKQTIFLNENLNTIIGGRSTGKSLLLGVVAKKLHSHEEVKDDNLGYSSYIHEILPYMKIIWKDGSEGNERDIDYFPQGHMHKLSGNKEELNNLISEIIKQDSYKQEVMHNYNTSCRDTSTEINNKINQLFQFMSELEINKAKLKETGDRIGIEKETAKLKEELCILKANSEITESEAESYTKLKDRHNQISKDIKEKEITVSKIEHLKARRVINNEVDVDLVSIDDALSKIIQEKYESLKVEVQSKWIDILSEIIDGQVDFNNLQIQNINEIEADALYIKGKQYFNNNIQFIETEKRLKIQQDKLSDIQKVTEEISKISRKIEYITSEVKRLHKSFFEKTVAVLDKLSLSKEFLIIKAESYFVLWKYTNILKWGINQRSYKSQDIVSFEYTDSDGYFKHIFQVFDDVLRNQITLKGEYTSIKLCQELLSSNPFKISFDIIYENDKFSQMSEGKKAFVILMLLLDFSNKDCPILIDQPEDDLDNRAIFNDLVKYLKNKKKERQIIIVTHNPNIVVGADSELVIVANQQGSSANNLDGCKFQYVSGSLENTMRKNHNDDIILRSQGIKEHVCEILEGGDVAFKKRERKYSSIMNM